MIYTFILIWRTYRIIWAGAIERIHLQTPLFRSCVLFGNATCDSSCYYISMELLFEHDEVQSGIARSHYVCDEERLLDNCRPYVIGSVLTDVNFDPLKASTTERGKIRVCPYGIGVSSMQRIFGCARRPLIVDIESGSRWCLINRGCFYTMYMLCHVNI